MTKIIYIVIVAGLIVLTVALVFLDEMVDKVREIPSIGPPFKIVHSREQAGIVKYYFEAEEVNIDRKIVHIDKFYPFSNSEMVGDTYKVYSTMQFSVNIGTQKWHYAQYATATPGDFAKLSRGKLWFLRPFKAYAFDTPHTPEADVFSGLDGKFEESTANQTWDQMHDGTGDQRVQNPSDGDLLNIKADTTTDQYDGYTLSTFDFDINHIDVSGGIASSSACFRAGATVSDTLDLNVVLTNSNAEGSIDISDYERRKGLMSQEVSSPDSLANWPANGYRCFRILEAKENLIGGTTTQLGFRFEEDLDDNEAGVSWSSAGVSNINGFFSANSGTDKDPYLSILLTSTTTVPANDQVEPFMFE